MPNERNESASVSTDADSSALKTVFAASADLIITVGVWVCAILAVFSSKTAKKLFGQILGILKDTANLKRAKNYVEDIFNLVWPKLARGFLILGLLTIIGFSLILLLLLISGGAAWFGANPWHDFSVATAWILFGLGLIWAVASVVIYWVLMPLHLFEIFQGDESEQQAEKWQAEKWRVALSRPFMSVAMLIVTIAVLALVLPSPLKDAIVITVLAGMALLWLIVRRLTGKKDATVAGYVFGVVAVLAVWTIVLAVCPTVNEWFRWEDYKVTSGGSLFGENFKPMTTEEYKVEVGIVLRRDTSRKPVEAEELGGLCGWFQKFDEAFNLEAEGYYPLRGVRKYTSLELPPSTKIAASTPPFSEPPTTPPVVNSSRSPTPKLPDSPVNLSFEEDIGKEWVPTLVVYPEDLVLWNFEQDKMDTFYDNKEGLQFEACLGTKVETGAGTHEYFPSSEISTPTLRGGAGQYFARMTFRSNLTGAPMLIRYTGDEESVKIRLRLERNVLASNSHPAPDSPANLSFEGEVGEEWVDTRLVIYPIDLLIWIFDQDKLETFNDDSEGLQFEVCLGIRMPTKEGGFEYFPLSTPSTPTLRGGAGQYYAKMTFQSNSAGEPMLIRYTGDEESVKIRLRLERNVLASKSEGRAS